MTNIYAPAADAAGVLLARTDDDDDVGMFPNDVSLLSTEFVNSIHCSMLTT